MNLTALASQLAGFTFSCSSRDELISPTFKISMFSECVLDHKGTFDGRLERGVFWRGHFNQRNVSHTTFVRLTSKLALFTGMDVFCNCCTKGQSVITYFCLLQEFDLLMAVSQNLVNCQSRQHFWVSYVFDFNVKRRLWCPRCCQRG